MKITTFTNESGYSFYISGSTTISLPKIFTTMFPKDFVGQLLQAVLHVVMSVVKVFLLLPINKFIDWLKKPAQHLDLKVEKKGE